MVKSRLNSEMLQSKLIERINEAKKPNKMGFFVFLQ
jgi:hypothetical protein